MKVHRILFTKIYVEIIRDLELSERQYDGVPGYENRVAIVRTWKAYIYSIVVSMYGGMPLSDAMIFDPNKFLVKHDTEEEMYRQILDMLKKASESFNPDASSDVLKKIRYSDPALEQPVTSSNGVSLPILFVWK